jgi:hypothetical protein
MSTQDPTTCLLDFQCEKFSIFWRYNTYERKHLPSFQETKPKTHFKNCRILKPDFKERTYSTLLPFVRNMFLKNSTNCITVMCKIKSNGKVTVGRNK